MVILNKLHRSKPNRSRKTFLCGRSFAVQLFGGERETRTLTPKHLILSQACLPIPPFPHNWRGIGDSNPYLADRQSEILSVKLIPLFIFQVYYIINFLICQGEIAASRGFSLSLKLSICGKFWKKIESIFFWIQLLGKNCKRRHMEKIDIDKLKDL